MKLRGRLIKIAFLMWININDSEIQNDKQSICKIHVGLFREVLICTFQAALTVTADNEMSYVNLPR